MGLALKSERRISNRRRLSGLLPGPLFLGADRSHSLAVKPVDVSRNGLGLLLRQDLPDESSIVLVLKDREIELKVAWKRPDFGKEDMIRYGLVTTDPEVDLEQVFISSGCLGVVR